MKLAKDFSPNYIRIVQGMLSIAFDRAIVLGIAKKNPSRMIGNIKSKKTKVDFWTLEEFQSERCRCGKDCSKSCNTVTKTVKKAAKKDIKIKAFVEYYGKQVEEKDIIARVKKAWTRSGKKVGDIKEMDLYIKPEENAVYYVINGTETGAVEFE